MHACECRIGRFFINSATVLNVLLFTAIQCQGMNLNVMKFSISCDPAHLSGGALSLHDCVMFTLPVFDASC